MLKVVAETPEPAHGETAENPMPAPNPINSRVSAALAKPPAATAPHAIDDSDAIGSIKSVSAATMETSAALKSVMVRPRLRIGCRAAHAVGHGANHRNGRMFLSSNRARCCVATSISRPRRALEPSSGRDVVVGIWQFTRSEPWDLDAVFCFGF